MAGMARPVTRGEKPLLENLSSPLEKCVGHSLKLLDTVQKIWDPLRKLFAPPVLPSWLRAWAWRVPWVQLWRGRKNYLAKT